MAYADFDTYQGNFKKTYPDQIKKSFPKNTRLYNSMGDLSPTNKIGDEFQQPILLSREQGVTYAGTGKLVTLNAPNAANIQFAKIKSSEIDLRTGFPYSTITRSNGQGAFDSMNMLAMTGLRDSHFYRLEADFWHGQSALGWGIVGATVTATTFNITAATWASGLWIFSEGMLIDVFTAAGAFRLTATVTGVDIDGKVITVDTTGTMVTGDIIFPHGAKDALGNAQNVLGVRQILATNTGTVFSISATAYSMWKPTVFAVTGQLTFVKLNQSYAKAMPRGFGPSATQWVSPGGYADLINEIEGARHFTLEYAGGGAKSGKSGSSSRIPGQVERGGGGDNFLQFYSASGAVVKVIPHEYLMEGEAFALADDKSWFKVGSSDVTFEMPLDSNSKTGGDIFLHLPNQNGYEIRSFSDIAPFTNRRCGNIIQQGIVNAS